MTTNNKKSKTQPTPAVFMIRPANFGFNQQTAATNTFQNNDNANKKEIQKDALKEFDTCVAVLKKNNVEVAIFNDTPEPVKPDAIFPNNWISLHEDGTVILYPMFAQNRRWERRMDIVDSLKKNYQCDIKRIIDISQYENQNMFLEGTGSIVFDHTNKQAYMCNSPRSNTKIFNRIANQLNYRTIIFNAVGKTGSPIYHTNVMLCIGEAFAIVCLECIKDEKEKQMIKRSLEDTNHEIVEISSNKMEQFAGNMLEVSDKEGNNLLIMSQSAYNSLSDTQKNKLKIHATLLPIDVHTIEKYGGGSIRCMMAGIHTRRTKG